jgi:hypothetical protein
MDVVLRLFSLAGVFVGFGEGVCDAKRNHVSLGPILNLYPAAALERVRLSHDTPLTGQSSTTDNIHDLISGDRMYTVVEGWSSLPVCLRVCLGHAHALTGAGEERGGEGWRLTEGLEVFDGHKLGVLSLTA